MNQINSLSIQTVKPHWIDYNDHMNVAYYTEAFDHALDEYLTSNFGVDESYIQRTHTGPFALQSNFIYLTELREGEAFRIAVRIIDYSDELIHLFSTMHRCRDDELSATSESLTLFVDHNTRKSTPFPEEMYKKTQALHPLYSNEPIPQQVGQTIGIRRK